MTEQDLIDAWRFLAGEQRDVVRHAVLFALRAQELHNDLEDRFRRLKDVAQKCGLPVPQSLGTAVEEDTQAETPRAKVLRRQPS